MRIIVSGIVCLSLQSSLGNLPIGADVKWLCPAACDFEHFLRLLLLLLDIRDRARLYYNLISSVSSDKVSAPLFKVFVGKKTLTTLAGA